MFAKSIYCPACNARHRIKKTDVVKFKCSQCGATVNPNCQDLNTSYKPPANHTLWPIPPVESPKQVIIVQHQPTPKLSTKVKSQPVKTNAPTDNTVVKGKLGIWLALSVILYVLCAFAEFDVNFGDWTALARGIFGLGVVCAGLIAIIADFK